MLCPIKVNSNTTNKKVFTLDVSSFFGKQIDLENQVTGCSLMLSHHPP